MTARDLAYLIMRNLTAEHTVHDCEIQSGYRDRATIRVQATDASVWWVHVLEGHQS